MKSLNKIYNKTFIPFWQRKYFIQPKLVSLGFLTPKQKAKRSVIQEKYKPALEASRENIEIASVLKI